MAALTGCYPPGGDPHAAALTGPLPHGNGCGAARTCHLPYGNGQAPPKDRCGAAPIVTIGRTPHEDRHTVSWAPPKDRHGAVPIVTTGHIPHGGRHTVSRAPPKGRHGAASIGRIPHREGSLHRLLRLFLPVLVGRPPRLCRSAARAGARHRPVPGRLPFGAFGGRRSVGVPRCGRPRMHISLHN